jgi:hypothetical protein
MRSVFKLRENKALLCRSFDREKRVMNTILTAPKNKKNKKIKNQVERLSSITDRLRDIMVNEYYNLCRMHTRRKFIIEDFFKTGDYDDDLAALAKNGGEVAIELNVEDSIKLMKLNEMLREHYDLLFKGTGFSDKVIGDKVKDDMGRENWGDGVQPGKGKETYNFYTKTQADDYTPVGKFNYLTKFEGDKLEEVATKVQPVLALIAKAI